MEEIKVGEYIRTEDGIIDRIVIAENDDEMYAGERDPEYLDYVREDIIKHSSNIINLIEVGDIVRIEFPPDEYCNEPVEVIWTIKGSAMLNNLKCGIKSKEVKLKSIVTKEQFEAVEYRLED